MICVLEANIDNRLMNMVIYRSGRKGRVRVVPLVLRKRGELCMGVRRLSIQRTLLGTSWRGWARRVLSFVLSIEDERTRSVYSSGSITVLITSAYLTFRLLPTYTLSILWLRNIYIILDRIRWRRRKKRFSQTLKMNRDQIISCVRGNKGYL